MEGNNTYVHFAISNLKSARTYKEQLVVLSCKPVYFGFQNIYFHKNYICRTKI